jgi:DNA-binding response OmpR family regulator
MQARKILLVEDERPIAENIVYALKAEHFAVKWVPTGRDALKALREEGGGFHCARHQSARYVGL